MLACLTAYPLTRPTALCSETPLLLAARRGHRACVDALLQQGAEVDRASPGTGVTPLMAACLFGHDSVVEALLARQAGGGHSVSLRLCMLHAPRFAPGTVAAPCSEQRGIYKP